MRILFANNLRGCYGGVEQVIFHYARGLARREHEVFLAFSADGRDTELFSQPFISTLQCSEFGANTRDSNGYSFDAIIEQVQPDVLFFHKVTTLPPSTERTRAVRTVRMVHDADLFCPTGLGYFRHNRRTCHYRVGRLCWLDLAFLARGQGRIPVKFVGISSKLREMHCNQQLDAIIANSAFVRDKLISNDFHPGRIHLCHPILETEESVPCSVPETPHVLFVGSLLRGKGVDLLLRALQQLRAPFSASIVGTGKSESKLRRLCTKLGLDSRVDFKGWVPPTQLACLYEEAKVVAIPSCCPETFCLVGIEAMHHGRPVVAFDVGGISDWLEHDRTGILVPEQNVKSFAQALERLLTDTHLARQMGENGTKSLQERFSFEQCLDGVEDVLAGNPGKSEPFSPQADSGATS
ncbi:glycosyltransferase family 4 protein [Candidatus Hydrogenedentota bacterium]